MRRLLHALFGHVRSTSGAPFCDCRYGSIQFEFLKKKGWK